MWPSLSSDMVQKPDATTLISEFLRELADIKAERRKRTEDHTHGAEEPVWKLRRTAHQARREWREGRRLSKLDYWSLNDYGQRLVDDWVCDALSVRMDKANQDYGHGIARTHDFGYEPGQNMNTQIPTDVAAALKLLKAGATTTTSDAPAGAEEPGED